MPTTSAEWTAILSRVRRDPSELRGWTANARSRYAPLFALVAAGRRVALDDGELTANGHRWRWLVIDGDHIGRRESMTALCRLAQRCVGLDDAALAALKSREMDREDALAQRASG